MNSWWLKLYTIPGVKKIALKFLIPLLLVSLGHMLDLSNSLLGVLHASFLYPIFTFGDLRSEGLAWNLDFHKMSVPLKELRRIFFLDILIQSAAFILCALLSGLILLFIFPGYKLFIGMLYVLLSGAPSYLLLGLACLSAFFITARVGDPSKVVSTGKKMSFKDQMKFSACLLPGVLYIFIDLKGSSSFNFNSIFCVALVSLSFCVTRIVHFYYFNFHAKRYYNNVKGHLTTIGTSVLACFAFCFFCAGISRVEMNSANVDNFTKNKILVVFDDFAPTLEPETVQGLLNAKLANTEAIFKNASPEVFQMPVSQLLPRPDLHAYSHYLTYGKPSQENLVHIMRELEKRPKAEDWKHNHLSYNKVRFLLVKHLPHANALPEDLIKKKIETRKLRDLATEHVEK